MVVEHLEPIEKTKVPELEGIDDLHIVDYDDGKFHCTELFTHEGAFRGYAKDSEESLKKAIKLYKDCHKKS